MWETYKHLWEPLIEPPQSLTVINEHFPLYGVLNYMAVMNIGVCFLIMYISGQLQQRVDSTIGIGNDCIMFSANPYYNSYCTCSFFQLYVFFFSVLSQL